MAEPDVLDAESIRGLEAHAARHDVLQHAVVVALGDIHLAKRGRQVTEEHVDIPSLPGGHLRHEVLHVAQNDESRRASAVGQLDQLSTHHLRTARDADPFLLQLLFDSNVQVRDDEHVVRQEGGLVGDGFEVHARSKGGSA